MISHDVTGRRACNKYKQSLEIYWNIYGPDASYVQLAEALSNLGESQINHGGYKEALVNIEQALDMKFPRRKD